jgi:hypothetical protein
MAQVRKHLWLQQAREAVVGRMWRGTVGGRGTRSKVHPHLISTRGGRGLCEGGASQEAVTAAGGRHRSIGGGTKAQARARSSAQQGLAPDCLQPPLVPRSGFRQQVKPGVRTHGRGRIGVISNSLYVGAAGIWTSRNFLVTLNRQC